MAGDTSSWESRAEDYFQSNYNSSLENAAIGEGGGLLINLDAPNNGVADIAGYQAGTNKWLERIENYSPWNDVFSMQQQETELIIDIPFENRYVFVLYCLGYNYVDSNGKLRRINPIVHPYWNWMRCARVAHKGVRFQGKKVLTTGGGPAGVAQYKLARFSLGFANYPWRFYEDSQITSPELGQEIYRNTYYEFHPSTQFLSAEGGANVLKFPYKGTTNPNFPATSDVPYIDPVIIDGQQSFRASMGTPVNQIRFKLHWKWVPYNYVFNGFVPTNLTNAMGYLNQVQFLNDPNMVQGTLRVDAPEISTFVSPIRTSNIPELLCDIVVNMTYFNPPKLFIASEAERTSPLQLVNATASIVSGHDLVPDRLTGLWKPATRGGVAPTLYNQMLQYTDIYKIFQKAV